MFKVCSGVLLGQEWFVYLQYGGSNSLDSLCRLGWFELRLLSLSSVGIKGVPPHLNKVCMSRSWLSSIGVAICGQNWGDASYRMATGRRSSQITCLCYRFLLLLQSQILMALEKKCRNWEKGKDLWQKKNLPKWNKNWRRKWISWAVLWSVYRNWMERPDAKNNLLPTAGLLLLK